MLPERKFKLNRDGTLRKCEWNPQRKNGKLSESQRALVWEFVYGEDSGNAIKCFRKVYGQYMPEWQIRRLAPLPAWPERVHKHIRLMTQQRRMEARSTADIESHVQRLRYIGDLALTQNNLSVAATCAKLEGEVRGFYIKKSLNTNINTKMDIQEMMRRASSMIENNPDLLKLLNTREQSAVASLTSGESGDGIDLVESDGFEAVEDDDDEEDDEKMQEQLTSEDGDG